MDGWIEAEAGWGDRSIRRVLIGWGDAHWRGDSCTQETWRNLLSITSICWYALCEVIGKNKLEGEMIFIGARKLQTMWKVATVVSKATVRMYTDGCNFINKFLNKKNARIVCAFVISHPELSPSSFLRTTAFYSSLEILISLTSFPLLLLRCVSSAAVCRWIHLALF